ncbi:MAG TPA: hypothetical protein VGR08_02315, partial [Thermomicrobiales bacterium]|nr:hypothetical protein [Thermomicrobiales bacterium]
MTKRSPLRSCLDRRAFIATTSAFVGAGIVARTGSAVAQDGSDITVTMVTDTAGIGDQNFND